MSGWVRLNKEVSNEFDRILSSSKILGGYMEENFARNQVRDINLVEFKKGLRGREYRHLVEIQLQALDSETLKRAIIMSTSAFTSDERAVAEKIIDEYNQLGYKKEFWNSDCSEIFLSITTAFESGLLEKKCVIEEKMKFNLFNLVALNFAFMASEQKSLQEFIGIDSIPTGYVNKIQVLLQKTEINQVLSKYKISQGFIQDLLERMGRVGNDRAIENAKNPSNIEEVIKIYINSPKNWGEDKKFITACNFLEYGMK